jgi:autotransporter-associated beta strand protein
MVENRTGFGGRACFESGNRKWRGKALLCLATAPILVGELRAGAAVLTWDPLNTPATSSDGTGYWDSSNSLSNPDNNWSNGTADSAWVNGSTAAIGSGGTAGTITIDDASGSVTVAAVNFNPVGSGNYLVNAIGGNSLALTGTAALPSAITVAAGVSPTISAPISGANGLTLAGTGSLTLSGGNNYTGNTVLNSGTLTVNAGGTLGATTAGVVMGLIGATPGGSPTPLTTVSTLNVNTNETVASYTVNSNSSTFNTLSIGSGSTLSVSGAYSQGLNPKTGSGTANTNLVITGGGTLSVTNTTGASFQVGVGETDSANAAGQASSSLNMSGLSAFMFSTTTGEFDDGTGSHGAGNIILANASNSITAAVVRIGDSTDGTVSGNAGGNSSLQLGAGTNVIDSNTINVGNVKDNGTLKFAGSTGGLTINNEAGTGGANMNVGQGGSGTSSANGTVNLLGHPVNLTLGTLNLGNRTNSTTSNIGGIGLFAFDDGSVAVTTLTMAHAQGSTSTTGFAQATMQVGSVGNSNTATLTLNNGANLGQVTSAGTNSTATSLLLIDPGGTVNSLGNMGISVNGTGDVVNASVTLAGGTLNMNGHNINNATNTATSAVNNVLITTTSGLLENLGTINGTGGVTMATPGNTLTIAGANGWTGPTNLTGGTMVLASSPGPGTLGNTVVNVGSGTTFIAQSGTSIGNSSSAGQGGSLIAGANATLSLVDNTVGTLDLVQEGTFSGTALGLAGDAIDMDLGATGPDEIFVNGPGAASISGTNTINLGVIPLTASLPLGTFPLITGNGSADFTGTFLFPNSTQMETVTDASSNAYTLTLSNSSSGEFLNIALVPEPATVGGAVVLGAMLLGKRRRRRV